MFIIGIVYVKGIAFVVGFVLLFPSIFGIAYTPKEEAYRRLNNKSRSCH
jgi:hypothetical protein